LILNWAAGLSACRLGTMSLLRAEAIVLKGSALSEADLIFTLFTREFGKIRAVAKSARRLKSRFGGALEPLTYIRVDFYEKENRDLVYLNRCEVEETFFDLQLDYGFQVACAYLVEVVDGFMPEREANARVFRLILALLRARRQGVETVQFLAYFNYWILRLSGLLPEMDKCSLCGESLESAGGFYSRPDHRAYCGKCKPGGGDRISADLVLLAKSFSRRSLLGVIGEKQWSKLLFDQMRVKTEVLVLKSVDKALKSIDLLHDSLA
jgi:DNA repair protein RecO (recombination protein O)